MGMGDKKEKYVPKPVLMRCDVTERNWNRTLIRSCPEPNVRKKYYHRVYDANKNVIGVDTTVCMYICKRCKYGLWADNGVYCMYGKQH